MRVMVSAGGDVAAAEALRHRLVQLQPRVTPQATLAPGKWETMGKMAGKHGKERGENQGKHGNNVQKHSSFERTKDGTVAMQIHGGIVGIEWRWL